MNQNQHGDRDDNTREQFPLTGIGTDAREGVAVTTNLDQPQDKGMRAVRKIAPRFANRLKNRMKKI